MGWQDSNLRMTESKSVVLPLDDSPTQVSQLSLFSETAFFVGFPPKKFKGNFIKLF